MPDANAVGMYLLSGRTLGLAVLVSLVGTRGPAAIVTGGATLLPDSFAGVGTTAALSGATGLYARVGSTTGWITGNSAAQAYQLAVTNLANLPPSPAPVGYVTYTTTSLATVGTIIDLRWVNTTYAPNTPFTVSLTGYGDVLNLAGVPDTVTRMQVKTLSPPVQTNQMVHTLGLTQVSGFSANGEVYCDSPQVLRFLPKIYNPVPVDPAGVSASRAPDWPTGTPLRDLVRKNDAPNDNTYYYEHSNTTGPYWAAQVGSSTEVYLDLGLVGTNDVYAVSALALAWRGDHLPDMDIFSGSPGNWSSTPLGHVTGQGNEFIVIQFNQDVATSHLMFREAQNSSLLLFKALPLLEVPEPASGTVFALTALAALCWRRR